MLPKRQDARIRKTSPPHEHYDARCFRVSENIWSKSKGGVFLFKIHFFILTRVKFLNFNDVRKFITTKIGKYFFKNFFF